ncbi:MAG: hypothetical protein J6K58_13660 [Lachnospiraceae bacterium]|nr:hypothetical protein [Lachnospiraceae bacterium]
MKNIENFNSAKYENDKYTKVEEGIYKLENDGKVIYVTSLSFIQEPELDEGDNASYISQVPLEDILDEFYCYISDFYEELNTKDSEICYQEFASDDLEDVKNLRTIIGKHVYSKEVDGYSELVIEG